VESALECWRARKDDAWIAGCEPATLQVRVNALQAEFARRPAAAPVEITATERVEFVATFLAAITHWHPLAVFLGPASPGFSFAADATETRVMIATGGTTGAPRYAVHTWQTLAAAARALQQRLDGGPIDSVCFLPLTHVSGLMQVVRSFVSGGRLAFADWREIEGGKFPAVPAGAVTSLVPTQLARLLDTTGALAWLRRFRTVFVGGAAASRELLERSRRAQLPLAPCYGMTETAAQITLLMPEEFLAGRDGVGRTLPHAQVEVLDETTGRALPVGAAGQLQVRATSLFLGYHLDGLNAPKDSFLTADRGVLATDGSLTLLGRLDDVINTGGEKVDPAEVEAAIRATALVQDVAVFGMPDREWGEVVVALIAGALPGVEREIAQRISLRLAAPQRPKRWVHVPRIPRSAAGKMDRRELRAMAERTV
jgi:o-succinylbenzoate---CoA ligase